jgi:spore coat protein U-like protein
MKLSNAIKFAFPSAVLGCLTLGLTPTPAFASTSIPTTFNVTATVQSTCVISATAMSFGTYTAVVSNSTSTVTVTCTNTTPYTVALNAGAATGATVTNRSMTGTGSALLGYALYSDTGRTVNFATTASITGSGAAQPITIYGQIPAGEYVAPGSYTDTITATVTY